jgi:hypothetical protein
MNGIRRITIPATGTGRPPPRRPAQRLAVKRHLALQYDQSSQSVADYVREGGEGTGSKRIDYVDYLRASVDLLTQGETVAFDDLLLLHEGLTWLRGEVQDLEETLAEYRTR